MRKYIRNKRRLRSMRQTRVRKKVQGTASVPRLSVNRTNQHLYVQLIDDENGHTLGSTSTVSKEFRSTENNRRSKTAAKALGSRVAEICKELNVSKVKFDRGSTKYHGMIAELANSAREGGLEF